MLTYAKVCSALQNLAGLENPPLKINLNRWEVAVKRPPLLYITTSDEKLKNRSDWLFLHDNFSKNDYLCGCLVQILYGKELSTYNISEVSGSLAMVSTPIKA